MIDYFPVESRDTQMQVVRDNIAWARDEKRVFLRQSLDIKLVGLYVSMNVWESALTRADK